jgi:hypothetical protein
METPLDVWQHYSSALLQDLYVYFNSMRLIETGVPYVDALKQSRRALDALHRQQPVFREFIQRLVTDLKPLSLVETMAAQSKLPTETVQLQTFVLASLTPTGEELQHLLTPRTQLSSNDEASNKPLDVDTLKAEHPSASLLELVELASWPPTWQANSDPGSSFYTVYGGRDRIFNLLTPYFVEGVVAVSNNPPPIILKKENNNMYDFFTMPEQDVLHSTPSLPQVVKRVLQKKAYYNYVYEKLFPATMKPFQKYTNLHIVDY